MPQLSLHAEIQRLRTSLLRLEEDKSNLDEAHSQLSRSTTQLINGQKSHLAESTRQAKFFEDESITWKRIAEERDQRLRELEEENDALKSRKVSEGPVTTDPSTDNDWKVVRDELSRQASYLRNLESSNARMSGELIQLRERNESIEVLKEQNRDLKRKLVDTDSLRQSVGRLEAEVEAARKEREEWCVCSRPLTRSLLIPIPQGIEDACIRASCAHSRICDPQSYQPTTRTRARAGGVRGPQSCFAAEGAGGT